MTDTCFRLRAGDLIRFAGQSCRVVRVTDSSAVVAVTRPPRQFTTLFGVAVRIQPKPSLVRIPAPGAAPTRQRGGRRLALLGRAGLDEQGRELRGLPRGDGKAGELRAVECVEILERRGALASAVFVHSAAFVVADLLEVTVTALPPPCIKGEADGWKSFVSEPSIFSGGIPGNVEFADCSATLTEGDSFVVAAERNFVVPTNAGAFYVSYAWPSFDTTSAKRIRDTFEVALVDFAGRPVTYTIQGQSGNAAVVNYGIYDTPLFYTPLSHPRHAVEDLEAGSHHRFALQSRVTEPDRLERTFAQDQSIAANAPEDSGVELIRATRVVRVDQHQFHVPFVQRLHLFGTTEADQMFLISPPGFSTDALFFNRHRHPVLFPQPFHNLGGGNEGVTAADPKHRAFSEDAGSLMTQVVFAQGRGLEL